MWRIGEKEKRRLEERWNGGNCCIDMWYIGESEEGGGEGNWKKKNYRALPGVSIKS